MEPPGLPDQRTSTIFYPSVRGLKFAENQSPRPQDRFFYYFNFFDDINKALNQRFAVPIQGLQAYRHVFGLEKTFDQGRGSVGFRLPINTLTGDSRFPGLGRTTTAVNDLSLFTKYILKQDAATGSLISVGGMMTLPTGPDTFANADYIRAVHTTTFQPFLGYILNRGDFYLHGFSAIEFPVNPSDVTIMYNDFGVGYWLFRSTEADSLISAIAPTVEVHVNTPLNHRHPFDRFDIAGTPDVVNLTYGLNVGLGQKSILTFGLVQPLTAPKPFDYEAVVQLNVKFGPTRGPLTAPVIGGP